MRKRFAFILLSSLFLTSVSQSMSASAASSTSVKNCVNIKSGEARLVSATAKCKKGEKLVTLALPVLDAALYTHMHSGTTPPIDGVTGHEGDFYINTSTNQIYGPRKNGLWGPPINITGAAGINGSALISGEGVPNIVQGIYGDFYLDVKNYRIYGPKNEREGWGVGVSLIGPQGATGAQGPQGASGSNGAPGGFGSHGSFYDTSTVTLTKDIATPIPLNTTAFASGVSIVDGSKITFANAGKYNIAFSSQITKADNGDDTISVWLCKGVIGAACSNVPWSNTDMIFSGNNSRHVAAWNFFMSMQADEYVQLMISSNGTTLQTKINSLPAQSSPSRPEIPGTILTVNQVG